MCSISAISSASTDIPWRFSANIFRNWSTGIAGYRAGRFSDRYRAFVPLCITVEDSGADIYIVNLLGIAIIQRVGTGYRGRARAGQLGIGDDCPDSIVMRVTEEIDALATMGVPRSLRLVLPKVAALSVTVPLLVVWCSAARDRRRHGFGQS